MITNISIITDYKDLQMYLHDYITNITTGDFGHDNKRIKSLPNIYDQLQKWEAKNIEALQDQDKEVFYSQKQNIEKIIDEFKLETINPLNNER